MKEKLVKLINVKSIITIILCIVFSYMVIVDRISEDNFMIIFMMIITFYFGTQYEKNNVKKEGNE